MDEIFRKAALKALIEWGREGGLEDLIQELWVWYLERPGTQQKFSEVNEFVGRRLAYKAALQILAKESLHSDTFEGRVLYSSDSVKEALRGESSNKYLRDILPIALAALDHRNPGQAEAIRSRYVDCVVPEQGAENALLVRAVKSLTDEINVLYLTSNIDDVKAVRPDSRRSKGQHADPTADIALMLIENPEYRHDYLEETTFEAQLRGENAQPVRLDLERNATVRDVPGISHPGALPPRKTDADPELEPTG